MNENECTNDSCPVHSRADVSEMGDYGRPYFITYVGEFAVYSDVQVNPDLTDCTEIGMEALEALLSGGGFETVRDIIDRALTAFTVIYRVGEGAIGDSPNREERYSDGAPDAIKDMHEIAVEMMKMRQEL